MSGISARSAGGSEEDNELYLRYYADDEDRQQWRSELGEPIPPKEEPPYVRDRFSVAQA